jgi:trehalose 2-sulfotransferase
MAHRRGVLVLSEGRSGSNWLGSLTTSAGLGRSAEWLDSAHSGMRPQTTSRDVYFETVLDKATNGTSGFYVKLFPRHLHRMDNYYQTDFIEYCRSRYDVKLIRLTRNDRIRQAVSFSRGLQTSQWTSKNEATKEPQYDFDQICRSFFLIGRSYDFWKSYVEITGGDDAHFVYEDLIGDPSPFVNHVADCLGQPHPAATKSSLKIQRDSLTEQWVEKFMADARSRNFLTDTTAIRVPGRSLKNLIRFFRKQHPLPYPYAY